MNKTWKLDDLPPNRTLVNYKWVLWRKYSLDSSILKYKAHIVIQGSSQEPRLNYLECKNDLFKKFYSLLQPPQILKSIKWMSTQLFSMVIWMKANCEPI
jgi:hypothetical protein